MSKSKIDFDRLLEQTAKHWLDQGPEEIPLACPDCHKPFGHMGLLDGFNLNQEEFQTALGTGAARERIPPITMTCPHCGNTHDVNAMGVWMFQLVCLWETLLEKNVISVEGGFQAFLRTASSQEQSEP